MTIVFALLSAVLAICLYRTYEEKEHWLKMYEKEWRKGNPGAWYCGKDGQWTEIGS